MPRALETDGLPIVLAMALWPWIDAAEAAGSGPGTGGALRKAAEKAVRDLRRSIIVTAPLETMLEDALRSSGELARAATRPASEAAYVRMDALLALGDLIAWLRRAKPSEWARAAGVGW